MYDISERCMSITLYWYILSFIWTQPYAHASCISAQRLYSYIAKLKSRLYSNTCFLMFGKWLWNRTTGFIANGVFDRKGNDIGIGCPHFIYTWCTGITPKPRHRGLRSSISFRKYPKTFSILSRYCFIKKLSESLASEILINKLNTWIKIFGS